MRAASSYRAARRNAVLRPPSPALSQMWPGVAARVIQVPPVRANKRDRTESANWMRANPFKWQRQVSIVERLKAALAAMYAPRAA